MTDDLARWQFATTSIYHFLFVPVTIGLAFLVALAQTAWYRDNKPEYKGLAKLFGTLLLINVAVDDPLMRSYRCAHFSHPFVAWRRVVSASSRRRLIGPDLVWSGY